MLLPGGDDDPVFDDFQVVVDDLTAWRLPGKPSVQVSYVDLLRPLDTTTAPELFEILGDRNIETVSFSEIGATTISPQRTPNRSFMKSNPGTPTVIRNSQRGDAVDVSMKPPWKFIAVQAFG